MVETRANGGLQAPVNGTCHNKVEKPTRKRVSNGGVDVNTKRPRIAEKTDRTRWRCRDESGRLTWHYLEDDAAVKDWPQSAADKWYLGLDTVRTHVYSARLGTALLTAAACFSISPISPNPRNPLML